MGLPPAKGQLVGALNLQDLTMTDQKKIKDWKMQDLENKGPNRWKMTDRYWDQIAILVLENAYFQYCPQLLKLYKKSHESFQMIVVISRWQWQYFKVIRLFHIKFLINGALYGKNYYS